MKELRNTGENLRRNGHSIYEISQKLGVAPSTVSGWCKNLNLTETEKKRITQRLLIRSKMGRQKGGETNRQRKLVKIQSYKQAAIKEIGRLSRRDIFIAGTALYWAEGNKVSEFAITNSDPNMIKFALKWFEVLGIEKGQLRPRITINSIHHHRLEIVETFWRKLIDIPKEQFRPTVLLKNPPKKRYENHDNYYGVLALQIRKGSDLKYRVLGLINALSG